MIWWQPAWDRYALAAAILKQLSFLASMAHRRIVLAIAAGAEVKKRGPLVAVLYDELVRCVHACVRVQFVFSCLRDRKHWSELARRQGRAFDVDAEVRSLGYAFCISIFLFFFSCRR